MKKFSPVAAVITLAAVLAIGVVVGRKRPTAESAKTAKPTAGPVSVPAAASQPEPDSIEVLPGGFDPQQVKVAQANQFSVPVELSTLGKLVYSTELTKLASAHVADRLDHILQFGGTLVRENRPIVELYAPDFIFAQKEYLLVLNTACQFKGFNMRDLLEDADVTVQSVVSHLHVLGMSDASVAQIAKRGTPAEHLTLRAPILGTTVKRNINPGAFLNVDDSLMSIADTRVLWFTDDVYGNDIASVRIGQPISLRTTTYPDREFTDCVGFIAPNTDPATHALTVHCDVPNTGGLLRSETYVTTRIRTGSSQATVVPKTVLVKDHGGYYVIVQDDTTHFKRVEVHGRDTGTDDNFAVTARLGASSRVVMRGAALLNEMIVKAGARACSPI